MAPEPQNETKAGAAPAQSARRALLIGVNKYPSFPTKQLHGCVNDVLEIRDFLVNRAGFPAPQVHLLVAPLEGSPPLPPDLGSPPEPTADNIRATFGDLVQETQPGDQVLLYYSGHGVRVTNRDTGEWCYGFAPTDIGRAQGAAGFVNMVMDREINALLRKLVSAGATVTAVLDSCHSASATRDFDPVPVRSLSLESEPLTAEQWTAFQKSARRETPDVEESGAGLRGEGKALSENGWLNEEIVGATDDWIAVSGCLPSEQSYEAPRGAPEHGALSLALLSTLKAVTPDDVAGLRWSDVFPKVRDAVHQMYPAQTPTLEGHDERPIFGGNWRPYEPGFKVQVTEGNLLLDGGTIQGLDRQAQVAIYPPDTADFAAAEKAGVLPLLAEIEDAELNTSTARLLDAGQTVQDGSRARLVKPGPLTPPLGVLLTMVPAEVEEAIRLAPGAQWYLNIGSEQHPPTGDHIDVEVRPWESTIPVVRRDQGIEYPEYKGVQGGWVILPYTSDREKSFTREDVIAYAPPLSWLAPSPASPTGAAERNPGDTPAAKVLGNALGSGLVHWARYCNVLRRSHTDSTLGQALQVRLRAGRDPQAMIEGKADDTVSRPQEPDAQGVYQLTERDYLWVEVNLTRDVPGGVALGILLCSNDGNIILVWPAQGAQTDVGGVGADEPGLLTPGQVKFIGQDAFNPGALTVRPDQESSLYTIRVIAYTSPAGQEPFNLQSLTQSGDVQMVIESLIPRRQGDAARGGFAGLVDTTPPAVPLWTTVDLPIRVHRE